MKHQSTIDWPNYPPRPTVFPLRVLAALVASEAARDIGANGFALVMVIAHHEDRGRCKRPVRMRNFELCAALGGISENSLAEIRRRTVAGGWIHYQSGNRTAAPVYWVTVPLAWQDTPPITPMIPPDMTSNSEVIPGGKPGERQGETTPHSIPIPKPNPPPTPTPDQTGEVVVLKRLVDLNVATAGETLQRALANGLTIDQISDLLTFAERHRGEFGAGAIVRRLTLAAAAEFPADQAWPEARKDPARDVSRLASDQAALRAKHQREDEAAAAASKRKKQLELEFGPAIDSRSPEELVELLPANDPVRPYVIHRRFGPTNPMVRNRLLEILAASAN